MDGLYREPSTTKNENPQLADSRTGYFQSKEIIV